MGKKGNSDKQAYRKIQEKVQKRDNYTCYYCGKDGLLSLDNWHDCTVDHFIPSGGDNEDNLITSCHYCNLIKGPKVFSTREEARKYIQNRRAELEKDFQTVKKVIRG